MKLGMWPPSSVERRYLFFRMGLRLFFLRFPSTCIIIGVWNMESIFAFYYFPVRPAIRHHRRPIGIIKFPVCRHPCTLTVRRYCVVIIIIIIAHHCHGYTQSHYSFYLKDGISILELGAAERSYLPSDLSPGRHVGVGAVRSLMEDNPSITESIVLDLNRVIEDEGLDSDEFEMLFSGGNGGGEDDMRFDAVIMANTIDFLNHPREVFK